MTDQEMRTKIQDAGLRVTRTRLLVYKTLLSAKRPLSHTDIVRKIQEDINSYGDQATIYRTLQVFTEKNLAKIGSNAGGIARYEIRDPNKEERTEHQIARSRVCCERIYTRKTKIKIITDLFSKITSEKRERRRKWKRIDPHVVHNNTVYYNFGDDISDGKCIITLHRH